MITNPSIDVETTKVLGVVSRALNVFGGKTAPAEPPSFAAPRDIEDNLGRGYFGSPAAASDRMPTGTGPADVNGDDDAGDQFANDLVDRVITGGGWTWANGGLGERR